MDPLDREGKADLMKKKGKEFNKEKTRGSPNP
jgi:hypothetical protein